MCFQCYDIVKSKRLYFSSLLQYLTDRYQYFSKDLFLWRQSEKIRPLPPIGPLPKVCSGQHWGNLKPVAKNYMPSTWATRTQTLMPSPTFFQELQHKASLEVEVGFLPKQSRVVWQMVQGAAYLNQLLHYTTFPYLTMWTHKVRICHVKVFSFFETISNLVLLCNNHSSFLLY